MRGAVLSIVPPAAVALPDVPREAVPFLIYKPIAVLKGILIVKMPNKAELRRQKGKATKIIKIFLSKMPK